MSSPSKRLGAFGESYARAYLTRAGYRILDNNVRLPSGEIDIVAREGAVLAFVEVRTRRSRQFGTPEESVTPAKARRLLKLGEEYLQERGYGPAPWRIDVVALEVDGTGRVARAALYRDAVHA